MKSMVIDVNGMEYVSDVIHLMGNRGGFVLFSWFFHDWQMGHSCTYSVMSFFRAGHQKSLAMAHVVLEIPGCSVCPHTRIIQLPS